jgi:hypothetical protein
MRALRFERAYYRAMARDARHQLDHSDADTGTRPQMTFLQERLEVAERYEENICGLVEAHVTTARTLVRLHAFLDGYPSARWHLAIAARLCELLSPGRLGDALRRVDVAVAELDGKVEVMTRRAALRAATDALRSMDLEELTYSAPEGHEE